MFRGKYFENLEMHISSCSLYCALVYIDHFSCIRFREKLIPSVNCIERDRISRYLCFYTALKRESCRHHSLPERRDVRTAGLLRDLLVALDQIATSLIRHYQNILMGINQRRRKRRTRSWMKSSLIQLSATSQYFAGL